jgi:hypothetical protein
MADPLSTTTTTYQMMTDEYFKAQLEQQMQLDLAERAHELGLSVSTTLPVLLLSKAVVSRQHEEDEEGSTSSHNGDKIQ